MYRLELRSTLNVSEHVCWELPTRMQKGFGKKAENSQPGWSAQATQHSYAVL